MSLKSADPKTDRDDIRAAFDALHPDAVEEADIMIDIFFAHGQWFVTAMGDETRSFSVVDAEGPNTCGGLAFEELG